MITEKVLKYVRENEMLKERDIVVAGVSGGADSVCLLFMLREIQRIIPIDIHAVHINHLIRPDAGNDAAYVQELCNRLGIAFTLAERGVEELAARRRISVEEAGRAARYEVFESVLEKCAPDGNGKIAVAHNKNDCCETLLFNLFRGSALAGLSGIRPVRGNVVRPLLCLERWEIEEFLDKSGIKYCIDSTNLEDNYTRNKIRHKILAPAVQEINPAAVKHIAAAAEKIAAVQEIIADLTKSAAAQCVTETKRGLHIDKARLETLRPAVQDCVIMETLGAASGGRRDLTEIHVAQVRALFERQSGRKISLPCGLCAERDYRGVLIAVFGREDEACEDSFEYRVERADLERLLAGERLEIDLKTGERLVFCAKKVDFSINMKNIPQKKCTKWLDYDKIENSIVVRCRKPGDYLTIDAADGAMNQKSLKSYFIDNKIPRQERDALRLVAEDSHVLWIAGGRISSFYKVGSGTKRILEIVLEKSD